MIAENPGRFGGGLCPGGALVRELLFRGGAYV